MSKVSILIPSRNETYQTNFGTTVLQQTVKDVLEKATGDIEVLVLFDGEPYQELVEDPRLRAFYHRVPIGSKRCIDELAGRAYGDYIMKLDSHCSVGIGFDEILQFPMEENWVVIPRFYVLNAEEWRWQDDRFYDYFYLPCPFTDKKQFRFQAGGHWKERTRERASISIDENMKLHGSCFFMSRNYFHTRIGSLDSSYDPSSGEDIEISLKSWLGHGKLMVNKNTWYAHMHKGGQRPRGYDMSGSQIRSTYDHIAHYWMGNLWENRSRDLQWLIEQFEPVPTWPDNWRELWRNYELNPTVLP